MADATFGYLLKKLDYPIAPLVLAMVLGDKAEDALRQSLIMWHGSVSIFWSNGLVATLMALAVLMALWPALAALRRKFAAPAKIRRCCVHDPNLRDPS